MFAGISYTYSQQVKDYEGFYGSVIYAFFKALGLNCIIEDHTNIVRIELTLNMREKIYLFEFKMTHHNKSALQQIKTQKYYEKHMQECKPMYLVGMISDLNSKNLAVFEWEKIQ